MLYILTTDDRAYHQDQDQAIHVSPQFNQYKARCSDGWWLVSGNYQYTVFIFQFATDVLLGAKEGL